MSKLSSKNPIAPYVKHAKRFGTESILEAASQAGLQLGELVALQVELDAIQAAKHDQFGATAKKHRLSAERRVKRYLGIEDDQEETA